MRERIRGWPGDKPLPASLWRAGEELLALLPPPRGKAEHWGGELPKAWLGVRTQVLTPELAAALGHAASCKGFRVTQVLPGTAAAKAGLQVGDVHHRARRRAARAGAACRRPRTCGGRWRSSRRRRARSSPCAAAASDKELTVALEPRPPQADEVPRAKQETLEFAVRELTLEDRVRYRWGAKRARASLVAEAERGGWAQMAGLRLDDLLLTVNDQRGDDGAPTSSG